jgi:ABC-type antimicrobial peptide transport system permease subunit
LGIGLLAAAVAGRWLVAVVYGVGAVEPLLFGAVFAVTLVVSVVATALAARRALAIRPIEVMRGS